MRCDTSYASGTMASLMICLVTISLLPTRGMLAYTRTNQNSRVNFGVNGHPLNKGAYSDMPFEKQISLLKELGFKTYRVNINPSGPDNIDRLSKLISIAEHEGVQILPVIVVPAKNYQDEDSAYNYAKAAAYDLTKQFGNRVPVWELGNEYDLYCIKEGAFGTSPADYDTGKYTVVRGLIRGMLAGLHDGSPSSQSIVETSQHRPYYVDSGFLQRLIADGVQNFDITGYHFYSKDGRIPTSKDGKKALKILHDQFHRPIWITEFDKSSSGPDAGPGSDPTGQADALIAGLREISEDAAMYDVIGADIYELLDQPELLDNPSVKPNQAKFGILDSHGGSSPASKAVQSFLRSY